MHKRKSFRKDAERVTKSTQVKLDEVFYRIEQEKKRSAMLNRFERIKVWNELRDIRRIFVPQYIPKCGLEQEFKQSSRCRQEDERSNLDQNNNQVKQKDYERQIKNTTLPNAALSPQRRRSIKEEQKKASQPVAQQTHSNGTDDKDATNFTRNEKRKISVEDKESLTRRHSNTCPSSIREYENSLSYLELSHTPRENTRQYIPITQRNNTSLSNTMLSVSTGYLSFRKFVRDKSHTHSLISPRFRCKSDSEITIEERSAFLRSTTGKNTTQSNTKHLVKDALDKPGVKNETSSKITSINTHDRRSWSVSAGSERNNKNVTRKKSFEGATFSSLKNIIEETTDLKKIPKKIEAWHHTDDTRPRTLSSI